ncbi:MAG: hypothetical protein KIT09_08055 [Bryobacteraceae bacterium]|nr:hypothetical protein [Bryobacteraceae bacterium]
MKFPFVLIEELTPRQQDRFHRHMNSDRSGWHRKWTESIWRRHQDPANAALSGWKHPGDRRRRLIHFYDEYDLDGRSFVLRNAYLSLNLTSVDEEVGPYWEAIHASLAFGGWKMSGWKSGFEEWRRGDLVAAMRLWPTHPEDERRGNALPPTHQHLEFRVQTAAYELPDGLIERPWRWFYDVGLRAILPKGSPTMVEPEQIVEHLPAQLELGCGPSTEAGIPHLSTLHKIYGVSKADFSFVFRAEEDSILGLFSTPEEKYREMTAIYRACIVAEPTPFYRQAHDLWRRRWFVGPFITNNFDCLCAEAGVDEMSLRRYDTEPYFTCMKDSLLRQIEFDPRAKSLLVIGVHADRRLAQIRARELGLRVIFIDPERYIAPDGSAIPYPVEAPQNQDLFVRLPAGEAMARLHAALGQDAAPVAANVAAPVT